MSKFKETKRSRVCCNVPNYADNVSLTSRITCSRAVKVLYQNVNCSCTRVAVNGDWGSPRWNLNVGGF